MNLQRWWPWYSQIVQMLNLDTEKDREATLILSKMLREKASPIKSLKEKIREKPVLIFGAGPSLETDLKRIINTGFHKTSILIAADGATTALLNRGVNPNIIATDLDGKIEDLIESNKNGSTVIIHAHGDNINALKAYVPEFTRPLFGTTQIRPASRVHNFGGFTDGDRCVFLAEKFQASKIILAGMDLGIKIGRYSKPNLKEAIASPLKQKKLTIAKHLIEWLSTWSKTEILNLTSDGLEIKGVKRITEEQLTEII